MQRTAARYLLVMTACAASSLAAPGVLAEPFHHQPLPLGERALGMGGAFTGLANDPSAAYYNPAGLVRLEDTSLSAGLTLSAFDHVNVASSYRPGTTTLDLKHAARPSLPLFVSLVKQVGPRDEQRRRHHAVAFTTFTLDQRRLTFDAKSERVGPDGRTTVDTVYVNHEESSRWHGLSYAYRLNDEITLGISTFLAFTRMNHAEELLQFTLGEEDAMGLRNDPTVELHSRRTSNKVINAVARLGFLYALPRLRLGVMFQLPSLHIKGTAKLRDREVVADALEGDATGTYYEASYDDLGAREPFPWELRLGGSYQFTADFIVALDGSVYGLNGSEREPIVAIGERPADEDGRRARAGDYAVEVWRRKMTGNVALGTEYVIYDAVVLRAGMFTDLSAAPGLPPTARRYRPADINRYGAALSVGLATSGYDVSLGALGRYGKGDALAFDPDSLTAPYQRTSMTEKTLFVFVTGARRAVGRLASTAVDKLSESRQEALDEAKAAEAAAADEPPAAPGAAPREPPERRKDRRLPRTR